MDFLPIILILLIVLIVVGMVVAFSMNKEAERRKHVMNVIKGQEGALKGKVSEKEEQNKRLAEIARKLKEAKDEDVGKDGKKKTTTVMKIEQAGLKISVKQFWIFSVISMVILTTLVKIMGYSLLIVSLAAVIGLLGLPRFVLKKMAAKRQKKFLEDFSDALDAMVRLLKAGMPVSEAVAMISKEFTGPLGEEMAHIYDKQRIGVPLQDAALEATRRMPLPEMQMFATGLAIQAQTGSSLSEVLMNLSGVIRARFRLRRKVKALSSEAIASASIIGALPILVAVGMYFANYDYIMILFTTSSGKVVISGAVIWMCVGIGVMKVMINFKI